MPSVTKDGIIATITIAFIVGLYVYIHTLTTRNKTLESNLLRAKVELTQAQSAARQCKAAVITQNNAIFKVQQERDTALNELSKWKKRPPKVKYKVIHKIIKVKSNDCKQIKDTLNAVRNINPDDL